MPFTKAKLRLLRTKIEAALQEFGEAEKISIEVGGARFNDNSCTFKLELTEVGADGTVTSRVAEDFKRVCARYGLKPEALKATFEFQGKQYTITGAKPRSSKYPILGANDSGSVYKFRPEDVCLTITDKSLLTKNPVNGGPVTASEQLGEW